MVHSDSVLSGIAPGSVCGTVWDAKDQSQVTVCKAHRALPAVLALWPIALLYNNKINMLYIKIIITDSQETLCIPP